MPISDGPIEDTTLTRFSDDLADFLVSLNSYGYSIGTDQVMVVHRLLLSLAINGDFPDEPSSLGSLIGPIVCTSAIEQQDFARRFSHWFGDLNQSKTSVPAAQKELVYVDDLGRRNRWFWLAAIPLVLAALVLLTAWTRPKTLTTEQVAKSIPGTPVPADGYPPLPPAEPVDAAVETPPRVVALPAADYRDDEELTSRQVVFDGDPLELARSFGNYFLGVLVILLSAAACWLFWRMIQGNLYLQRRFSAHRPTLRSLVAGSRTAPAVFDEVRLSGLGKLMRQRETVGSQRLNLKETIRQTALRGGLFHRVFGNQQVVPEYLILVDRISYRDHQANLARELLNRLNELGVHFTCLEFIRDPRTCYPVTTVNKDQSISLESLVSKHAGARLLLCSESACLVDVLTGEPGLWNTLFFGWSERAILTPESMAAWGYSEWQLTQQGWVVMPFSAQGLERFVQHVNETDSLPTLPHEVTPSLPDILKTDTRRWTTSRRPSNADTELLLSELKRYLTAPGYLWISACAVYPEIDWRLTLYLGNSLGVFSDRRLTDLARLPWFRVGRMPDWLRELLIDGLGTAERRRLRKLIDKLLIDSIKRPQAEGVELTVAFDSPQALASASDSIDDGEPLAEQDYVFATFMKGFLPSKLTHRLPTQLSSLFRKQLQFPLSLRSKLYRTGFYATVLAAQVSAGTLVYRVYRTDEVPFAENIPASSSYSGDLTQVITAAIADLKDGKYEQFVDKLYPSQNHGFISSQAQDQYLKAVSDLAGSTDDRGTTLAQTMLADLQAIKSFTPELSPDQTIATYVVVESDLLPPGIGNSAAPMPSTIPMMIEPAPAASSDDPLPRPVESTMLVSAPAASRTEQRQGMQWHLVQNAAPMPAQDPFSNEPPPTTPVAPALDSMAPAFDDLFGAPPAPDFTSTERFVNGQNRPRFIKFQKIDGVWRLFDASLQIRTELRSRFHAK